MPITTIGSHITTMQDHDEHWELTDQELMSQAAPALLLPGNFGRPQFQALQAELQAIITGLEDLENERQLSTDDRDSLKLNLRDRVILFRRMVTGSLTGTRYVRGLPKTPPKKMGELKFLARLDDMASLWTRIDADMTVPDFTPPMLLAGNYGLAGFTADLETLRGYFKAVTSAEQDLAYNRQKRDDMLPEIRRRLGQYHDIVEATFGLGHPLVDSLPDISPPSGGGTALETLRYFFAETGASVYDVWIEMQAGLVDPQTLYLRHGTTEFSTAFSPLPGEVFKTAWSGVIISGEIDEVKVRNSAGEDIAVGVLDPTLPEPG